MTRKHFILMRHAKSSWKDPDLEDAARPLNRRGCYSAEFMAGFLEARGWVPELICCSPAIRSLETANIMVDRWQQTVSVVQDERLYLADEDSYLKRVAEFGQESAILIIGHNPGLEDLMAGITGMKDLRFPTAAVAIFQAEDPWSTVDRSVLESSLHGIYRPKELPGFHYKKRKKKLI